MIAKSIALFMALRPSVVERQAKARRSRLVPVLGERQPGQLRRPAVALGVAAGAELVDEALPAPVQPALDGPRGDGREQRHGRLREPVRGAEDRAAPRKATPVQLV